MASVLRKEVTMEIQIVLHEHDLTDLFYTQAFSGAWEVFSKFNWLGWLMQFIISAFCLLGLFLTAYQLLVTMLYLSSRTTFDRIHELKSVGKGGKILGLGNLLKDNIITANNGTGLDGIVSFLLSLLPDVKAYSDYGEERRCYNLQDDDTITTYMLKKALPTLMIIFFFSIGFNGTLFRAYGMVVDAMAVGADEVVSKDLESLVVKYMNSGSGYKFNYDADNTEFGKFKQRVATSMYSKILSKCDDLSTDSKYTIGANVDTVLNKYLTAPEEGSNKLGNLVITDFNGTDRDVSNLQYEVFINATKAYSNNTAELWGSDGGKSLADFGLEAGTDDTAELYVHVYITKKANSTTTDYFRIEDDDSSDGGSDEKTDQHGADQ